MKRRWNGRGAGRGGTIASNGKNHQKKSKSHFLEGGGVNANQTGVFYFFSIFSYLFFRESFWGFYLRVSKKMGSDFLVGRASEVGGHWRCCVVAICYLISSLFFYYPRFFMSNLSRGRIWIIIIISQAGAPVFLLFFFFFSIHFSVYLIFYFIFSVLFSNSPPPQHPGGRGGGDRRENTHPHYIRFIDFVVCLYVRPAECGFQAGAS